MSIRLVLTMNAMPGKAEELIEIYKQRVKDANAEPGCLQFEAFRSVTNPDKIVLLEHWKDDEIFAQHMKRIEGRPPLPAGLRTGDSEREDYSYNRTR